MGTALKSVFLCLFVVLAGCNERSEPADEPEAVKSNEMKGDVVRLGAESKAEAIFIAKEYMAEHHAELDISHRPPSAEYFAKAAHDDKPLWVVGFAVPRNLDASGRPADGSFRKYYTFGLWIRENGNVESTMITSP